MNRKIKEMDDINGILEYQVEPNVNLMNKQIKSSLEWDKKVLAIDINMVLIIKEEIVG